MHKESYVLSDLTIKASTSPCRICCLRNSLSQKYFESRYMLLETGGRDVWQEIGDNFKQDSDLAKQIARTMATMLP